MFGVADVDPYPFKIPFVYPSIGRPTYSLLAQYGSERIQLISVDNVLEAECPSGTRQETFDPTMITEAEMYR